MVDCRWYAMIGKCVHQQCGPGTDPGGSIAFPKTFERNFFHHDFEEFGKQHSRHTAIKPSISLSQQCCKGYFISLTTTCNEIDYELLLKSPP